LTGIVLIAPAASADHPQSTVSSMYPSVGGTST
jgi:hypothetical protein